MEIKINKGSNLRLSQEIIQLLIRKPDFDDDDSWFSKILFQFLSCANKLIFLRFLREKLLEKEKNPFQSALILVESDFLIYLLKLLN